MNKKLLLSCQHLQSIKISMCFLLIITFLTINHWIMYHLIASRQLFFNGFGRKTFCVIKYRGFHWWILKSIKQIVTIVKKNIKWLSHESILNISIILTWHWSFPNQSQFSNLLLNLGHFLPKLIHPGLDTYCHILCHILVHLVV